MNIAIFGAGAWGSAMAIHLNRCGGRVTLLPRRLEHAVAIAAERENSEYLPGVKFPQDIQIAFNPVPVLFDCDAVVFACPSKALRATVERLRGIVPPSVKIAISLCKGLETGTLLRPGQVLSETLPQLAHGAISGPTNAAEVAAGLPAAVAFASDADPALVGQIQREFSNERLRIYRTRDIAGVELCGALKNIYAIAAGICDGMRFGANARASLLTRSLAEMARIIEAEGGKLETVLGLSGVGDLVATATSDWSRNRAFGIEIGRAGTAAALEKMARQKSVVEGFSAARNFYESVHRAGVYAPILDGVYAVVHHGFSPKEIISGLMLRELKEE